MAQISAATLDQVHPWRFFGVTYGERVGGDRALYRRVLSDGTILSATVRDADGRPVCEEIVVRFANGARNVGRELAISELELAINESDQHRVFDERTQRPIPLLAMSEIPYGVAVRGSRGRTTSWPDERRAVFVRDLQAAKSASWQLSRRRERELANNAVARGLAVADQPEGRQSRWRLTAAGEDAASRYRPVLLTAG